MSKHHGGGRSADPAVKPQARILLDAQGLVTEWSDGAVRLLGWTAEEVNGRALASLLAGPDEAAPAEIPQQPPARGACRVRLRDRFGQTHEVDLRVCLCAAAEATVTWAVFLQEAGGSDPGEFDRAVVDALLTESTIGLNIFDSELRLVRVNTESSGLRGIDAADLVGLRARDVAPGVVTDELEQLMYDVLEKGEPVLDFLQPGYPPADPRRERILSMSIFRLQNPSARVLGLAGLVADVTERIRDRARLDLLNDAGVRIGTTLDITRTAQELADVAVPRVADGIAVDVLESAFRGEVVEPGSAIGEVTVRRAAFAAAEGTGMEPAFAVGERLTPDFPTPYTQALADLRPRLLQHLDEGSGWLAPEGILAQRLRGGGVHSLMVVPLAARGVVLGVAVFYRSAKTAEPFDEQDLTIAAELASRAAVCVDNARRYMREHTAALVLQSSLLPQGLPAQNAVDAAYAHLPAARGGGTWFDLIPVSGARVALTVGEVAGHGMRTVATMGRLRATANSLAALDLGPEEVLAHLNDLMVRLAEEARRTAANDPLGALATTASCVYAVYDPISRVLALARAGHPEPLVAYPDGAVETVEAPAGPALGTEGPPYETAERQLPEGSMFSLFSVGLPRSVAGHGLSEEGIARLQRILAHGSSVQGICDETIYTHLAGRPDEDVVLLLARTRVLGEEQVASWTFPSDPAIVSTARTLADRQLASWNLSELAITTELVVSELVTNALRYAGGTIQLRLIRDRALICEVTDRNTAAPHLRHPRTTDEGGRGLLMVAQLTERWGTRRISSGKIIWAEQPLPAEPNASPTGHSDG